MKNAIRQLALMSMMATYTVASSQPKDIPLLPDLAVVAPAPETAKELAIFSGKWSGYMSGLKTGAYMADGLLVVEKISSPSDIQVFYAGVWRFGSRKGQPYSYRVNANFVDGGLAFEAGNGKVLAKMASEDVMNVTITIGTGSNRGTFKRIDK